MKTVWVVVIDNEYGLDTTVFDNEAAAKEYLHNYVREYWHEVADSVEVETCPDDYDEACHLYFDDHPTCERAEVVERPVLSEAR